MHKWELAKYLIDAKKDIDSILFIFDNIEQLKNLNLSEIVNSKRNDFYIKCCVVLDNSGLNKKNLRSNNQIIEDVYYERNKNCAHKDENYIPKEFSTLEELASLMKKQIIEIKNVCSNCLPDVLTLDFVSYDRDLFRQINQITPVFEEKIKKARYPLYAKKEIQSNSRMNFDILYDAEKIKRMTNEEKEKSCVVINDGLNYFEGLQNRQDACIRMNILYDDNIWVQFNN